MSTLHFPHNFHDLATFEASFGKVKKFVTENSSTCPQSGANSLSQAMIFELKFIKMHL